MDINTFDEGIAPGGLRSKHEIKVLICYLYSSVGESMSKNIITEAILNYELANFFEVTAAFDELAKSDNLEYCGIVDGEETYKITENGRIVSRELSEDIAYSAREKALKCALELLGEKKTAKENSVEIVREENGYRVTCHVSGGEVELLSFSLFAPDSDQAEVIKKCFLSYPAAVYKAMLALMTQNREAAGEALEAVYGLSD